MDTLPSTTEAPINTALVVTASSAKAALSAIPSAIVESIKLTKKNGLWMVVAELKEGVLAA